MTSLYELSVVNFERILNASIDTLQKSEAHFAENQQDLDEMFSMRLVPDMLPFSFQIHAMRHHSLGAAQAILKGEMGIPGHLDVEDFAELVTVLELAVNHLKNIDEEAINAQSGKAVIFKVNEKMELPFTAENFVQSFALPNLYFHATTAYDMLRMKGVPLGKRDFLGHMALGLPG